MIEAYLSEVEEYIDSCEEITEVEIIRKSVWNTDMEIIALYRFKIIVENGGIIELIERLVEENGIMKRTKYSYRWQNAAGKLIRRHDNAPHHPEISTFPHHRHGENAVFLAQELSGLVF
jgi:predicted xylose isomerase-like sugar epimerase